jgi:uncharacterized protein (DUF1810 family)
MAGRSPDPFNSDPFNLERFVKAQRGKYTQVLDELRTGHKRTHWMWFIFPQIRGLGSSETAQFFAITSLDEARAYLAHPVLGPRLLECTALVNAVSEHPRAGDPRKLLDEIFGYPDNLKFHSSMTLFAIAGPKIEVFLIALQRYFTGRSDQETIALLGRIK